MESIRGEEAFDLHQRIVSNEKERRQLMAANAGLLSEMFQTGLYKEILGDEEGEWAGYLAQLEIYYTRSKVHALKTVYDRLTKKLNIHQNVWAEVPLTRLMDALPVITENNYEDWFVKAVVLTTKDWNIELRKAKGLPHEEDGHRHTNSVYDICGVCGRKEKHHNDTTQTA